jgi:hypothetical protein
MQVLRYTLVGLVLVALLAGLVYWFNMDSQVRLNGQVVRVRTIATSDASSVLIAEVRIDNPSDVPFVVRSVTAGVTAAGGAAVTGDPVAEGDLDRVLGYYSAEGPRYNETLKMKSRLAGKSRRDWTVPASFTLPKAALDTRRELTIEIEDVDGVRVKFTGK